MNVENKERIKADQPLQAVQHIIKGELVEGADEVYNGRPPFVTPKIDIGSLVWSRMAPCPAADVPLAEIIDILDRTGEAIRADFDGYIADALDRMARTCTLERRIVENLYDDLSGMFSDRAGIIYMLKRELGSLEILDGWQREVLTNGKVIKVRAFPPRILHVLAGNVPMVAAGAIIKGSLTKGVHLLKMPANDLHTAPAILRTMARIAPNHPILKSFTAVYWRGGDERVEGAICRPQYFDKIAAWGGERAITGIKKYAGPGLELITFDPKTSISLIGKEVFDSQDNLEQAAELAAIDVASFDQSACVCSRFQFIEGSVDDVDRYCEALHRNLRKERRYTAAACFPVPTDIREEIQALAMLEPDYRVWGGYDGSGIVIRSDDPVEFHPEGKIVNVVRVENLAAAVRHASVATSTAGIYPFDRKVELRDALANAGAQRIVNLGMAMSFGSGAPHDGFYAMQRYMKWINDEGET
jgi:hypothetical protein